MKIRKYQVLLAHIVLQLFALFAAVHFLAQNIRLKWAAAYNISIPSWAYQPRTPKLDSIIEYLVLIGIGGTLLLIVVRYAKVDRSRLAVSWKEVVWFALYEVLIQLMLADSRLNFAGAFLIFLFPAWLLAHELPVASAGWQRIRLSLGFALITTLFTVLVSGPWNPTLRFINDYADFSTLTKMKDGAIVDSFAFAKEHQMNLYTGALRKPDSQPSYATVGLPNKVFKSPAEAFQLFVPTQGLVYDWNAQQLKIFRTPTIREKLLVQALWGISAESWQPRPAVKKPTASSVLESTEFSSPDISEFISKNDIELGSQREAGRFFYHHGYLYLPALEHVVADGSVIPAQYGTGLTWTLGKYLQLSKYPSFQNYYFFFWAGLYLYIILVGAVAWNLSKDGWMAALSLALAVSTVLAVSFDALRLAPGFNPIRHFIDIFCFLAVANEIKKRSWISWLVKIFTLTLFVWWNREFGLFFLGASIAWFIAEVCLVTSRWRRVLVQTLFELAAAALVLVITGSKSGNDLAVLNLMGVGANLTRWGDIFMWVGIWGVAMSGIAYLRFSYALRTETHKPVHLLDVAGIGVLYGAFSTIYVIWNPSSNHIAVLLLSLVIPATALAGWVFHTRDKSSDRLVRIKQFAVLTALASASNMVFANHGDYQNYEKIFANHELFHWRFKGLDGWTTANPDNVVQSLQLINSYAPTGRLVMISRYDNLILTAGIRASALPYVDLTGAAVSDELVKKIAGRILDLNLPYIFVDRDLMSNVEEQIARDPSGKPDPTAALRVGTLAALGQTFQLVTRCYEPGKTQGELQVWHRVCKADQQ